MDYCNLLLARKEYIKIKEIALPLVQKQSKFEFCFILGQACQGLSEFAAAVSFYADYLTHFGANSQVLNNCGDCFLQLGNKEEALKAWEKSLKLFSQQPRLKEKIAALKGGGK
jgi:tetratricopeptide (TPR) repeat protein